MATSRSCEFPEARPTACVQTSQNLTNVRVDGQKPDKRRQRRTSGQLTAKFISIKGAKRRFGGCAQKAAELTPGDLFRVASATEAVERWSDRGAEVSRGHSRS